jgi:hypothetical protein
MSLLLHATDRSAGISCAATAGHGRPDTTTRDNPTMSDNRTNSGSPQDAASRL